MNQSYACSLFFAKTNEKDACFRVPQSSSLPQSCAKEKSSGVEIGRHWCYGQWSDSWCHLNIAFLELYPNVLSLHLWGYDMKNQRILFFTHNEDLVYVINKQSCQDKNLMFLVCRLVLVCLEKNICFEEKHIPGVHNILADTLLCLNCRPSNNWLHST